VAQKLGIDTPKLQKAISDTRNEDVDSAVQNGDLTQKQADALKQRIQNMPGFGGRGMGGPDGLGRSGSKGFGPGLEFGPGMGLADASQKFADFLGITTDQLKTELQADNATIATVAAANKKSRDQVKTFITDGAKAKLDEAVKNGDLTQKREDAALKMLNDNMDKLLDGKFGFFFRGGFGGHMGPRHGKHGGNATPNTQEPQSSSESDETQDF
jgi:hypothetical protein